MQSRHAVAPAAGWYMPCAQAEQEPRAASGCTVPGLHGLWTSEPVEQKAPAGQAVHWPSLPSPLTLLNVPSWHGSGADAPSPQYEPAVQSRHAVSPAAGWYVPCAQAEQEPCAASGCTVPGLHGLCVSEPVEHDEPAGQEVHWPAAPSPVVLE